MMKGKENIIIKLKHERRKNLWKTKLNDVGRILGIGNKTCLDLFHRSDFPCIKVGKSFKVAVSSFNEYVSTRRVLSEVNE